MKVPFNRPHMTGRELSYIARAHQNSMLAGDGPFTAACSRWLEQRTGARKALLTHSCTAALDMAAILAGIGPGDEVILPSYTFVSTANAFVLRGGVPGFVGILPIILMFVLLYFLMIRPQMKRAKEHKTMVEALQKGDEVITSGGVLGRITKVSEAYILVEIAPNTEVSVQKTAVQTLLPKGTIKSIQ